MSVERRKYPRFEIMAQVRVRGEASDIHIMEVSNISRSGAFVKTEDPVGEEWIRVGAALELDIFASDELNNITVEAFLVRVAHECPPEQRGFGVAFANASSEARSALDSLIERVESESEE